MSDVEQGISRMFADLCGHDTLRRAEDGEWPEALWHAASEAGLLAGLVKDGDQGFGMSAVEAFEIVRLAGRYAVPVPIPETMVANWLLAQCGLKIQDRPAVVVADASLRVTESTWPRIVGSAASNWLTGEHFFWTKWANSCPTPKLRY